MDKQLLHDSHDLHVLQMSQTDFQLLIATRTVDYFILDYDT